LHELRETEPEPDTLSLFEAALKRLLDHSVILSNNQVVMTEACNSSIIENSIASEQIGLSVCILVDVAVSRLELGVDGTAEDHEGDTAECDQTNLPVETESDSKADHHSEC
jgi:hypothetical protein